jgi:hypothetical protein
MKKLSIKLTLSLFTVLLLGFTVSNAQLAAEVRPFDFNNDHYKRNGIMAEMLLDRKNGFDRKSVIDTPTEPNIFSDVRIIETLPAYAADGSAIFWNRYATSDDGSFTPDDAGAQAKKIAANYPVYVFPSEFVRGTDRQAALININERYFETNPLGIGDLVRVVFNANISRFGQRTLSMLAERNGTTIDGTPIIRTIVELKELERDGLVTLSVDKYAPYAIAKVIQFPERGGITPDAFLEYTKQADGLPLLAERHFLSQFECFQNGSRTCFSGR